MTTIANPNTNRWLHPPTASSRGWQRQIVGIKAHLSDHTDFETVQKVASRISAILMRQPEFEEGGLDEFSEIVVEMAEIGTADASEYDSSLTACDHFNACLERIYDWADDVRVIIA